MGGLTPEDIVARHYRGVYRYLARVTGSRDRAEDLTQEVFLHVTRAARNGHEVGHERGWVFAIARSVVAADHRSTPPGSVALSESGIRRESGTQLSVRLHGHSGLPLSVDGNQAMVAELGEALERLPAIDRDVLVLRDVAGLTYGEIAQACECTVESVRARLRRTRGALRGVLSHW